MTVDEFLDRHWRSVEDTEYMHIGNDLFKVVHVGDEHHVGYINGIPVGAADNMERTVRLIYAKWKR